MKTNVNINSHCPLLVYVSIREVLILNRVNLVKFRAKIPTVMLVIVNQGSNEVSESF